MSPERDDAWARQRREELQKEAALFSAQLVELEQEYACSSALLKTLGRVFGFGPASKMERARFKLSYKREQLSQFDSLYPTRPPER